MRGQFRTAGYRRVTHGVFLPVTRGDDDAQAEWLRDLSAWLLVLPAGVCFTHVTAARLRGWQLPRLPEHVPVFAAVRGDPSRPRRPGLVVSRLTHASAPELRSGLPVDSSEEILLRAARDLGILDLVIMIDAARRLGDLDHDRIQAILDSGRPGVRTLRAAYSLSCAAAASAGETLLRMFHVACEVPVQPQVELYDDRGGLVGQVDLLVTGTRFAHEYDGAHHRDSLQHRVDLRRDRSLVGAGYVRRGFTLDDLLNHARTVTHELDRALGRQHDPRRPQRWRRLVDTSLYSAPTRERVLNRWTRTMGILETAGPRGLIVTGIETSRG